MDVATITSLIGSLGFPIVCCIYLFVYMNKEREAHKQELDTIKDALNNNTLVLQKLIDRMDRGDVNGGDV